MDCSNDKKTKLACAGVGGGLGLAALAGACATGCGIAAAPLVGLFTSIGLGSVAAFLPSLRVPLLLFAAVCGAYAIRHFLLRKNLLGAAACGCVLGIGGAFLAWQMNQANDCKTASQIEAVLKQLSPQAKMIFQKGIYPIWPELGRAPTVHEVSAKLGFASDDPVRNAFGELAKLGIDGIVDSETGTIKVFWPFSSVAHGVEVTLNGMKTVHARCAIDALGMSAMFSRTARVSIQTPLDKKNLELEIEGNHIVRGDSGIVVSYSDSCDDMLFFASRDEFTRYVNATGKRYLMSYSLQEALERGIQSFGGVLKA